MSTLSSSGRPTLTAAPGPSGDPRSTPGRAQRQGYRPEIQGLRAVAVVLVAVYHIWIGRVSGGVDVFLLLTGFLITGSLVRMVERGGRVRFSAFLTRLAKRLFPAAAVVLAGVLVATFLWLPRSRWSDTIAEVVASALYYQNWQLSINAVDYLAQNNGASPVQHFWSLAIQGQFYLAWALLVALAALLASWSRQPLRRMVLCVVAAVFAVSLAYSVVVTDADQQWAYFDTGARMWELALGGLLALLLPYLRLPRGARVVLGWSGLAVLVFCGVLVPVSTMFPGYVALLPTGAAAAVIVAGTTGSRVGADRLLTWRPLTYIGDLAYALYLWHWPVLVFYLEVTERVRPSLVGGGYVLGLSVLLALATKWLVEGGVERFTRARTTPLWSLAAGAAFLVPVLIGSALWAGYLSHQQQLRTELASDLGSHPGAAVLADPELAEHLPALPVYPDTADAKEVSLDRIYECHARIQGTEMVTCDTGPETAERTIVLVGSSHAAHWLGTLRKVAEANDWRLITMTKDVCQFSAETQIYRDAVYEDCEVWKETQMSRLAQIRPDAVFTTSTRTQPPPEGESVPRGYVERWHQMDELGIDVIAIRDTPRLSFDAPACVDRDGRDSCVDDMDHSLAATPPTEQLTDVPDNVRFIDINDQLCPDGTCPTVIGNQLVYYDNSHFTYTFSESLSVLVGPAIQEATGWR